MISFLKGRWGGYNQISAWQEPMAGFNGLAATRWTDGGGEAKRDGGAVKVFILN